MDKPIVRKLKEKNRLEDDWLKICKSGDPLSQPTWFLHRITLKQSLKRTERTERMFLESISSTWKLETYLIILLLQHPF